MKLIKKSLSKLSIDNVINIVGHILTLISLLLVFFTLKEMQIQRNHTYMPQIVAEPDDNIEMKWDNLNDFTFIVQASPNYTTVNLDVYNIGVGVAKNIRFEWDSKNISHLVNHINKNSMNFSASFNNGVLNIKSVGLEAGGMSIERVTKLNFLASNNETAQFPYRIFGAIN